MTPAALADLVRSVARDVLAGHGLDSAAVPERVTLARPRDPAHGEYATGVALQTAALTGVAPRQLAEWLAEELVRRPGVRCAQAGGPGFLNVWLAAEAQDEIVTQVLAAGDRFGIPPSYPQWSPPSDSVLSGARYTHARLAALARNAADLGISSANPQLRLLDHPREGELIRTLGEFPRIVTMAAERCAPERVTRYLDGLAGTSQRFVETVLPRGDEPPGPQHGARLALCAATRQVLANGLGLLGASAPGQM